MYNMLLSHVKQQGPPGSVVASVAQYAHANCVLPDCYCLHAHDSWFLCCTFLMCVSNSLPGIKNEPPSKLLYMDMLYNQCYAAFMVWHNRHGPNVELASHHMLPWRVNVLEASFWLNPTLLYHKQGAALRSASWKLYRMIHDQSTGAHQSTGAYHSST